MENLSLDETINSLIKIQLELEKVTERVENERCKELKLSLKTGFAWGVLVGILAPLGLAGLMLNWY